MCGMATDVSKRDKMYSFAYLLVCVCRYIATCCLMSESVLWLVSGRKPVQTEGRKNIWLGHLNSKLGARTTHIGPKA